MRLVAKARMPTSSVGSDTDRGFTLLELLVALALGALLIAVVPSRLGALMDAVRYRNAVQDTLRALETARLQAIGTGQRTQVQIDVQQRQLLLDGQALLTWPDAMALQARGVADAGDDKPRIHFDPDGSASGGELVLQEGGRGNRIAVDWLTGRITVEPYTP